MSDRDLKLKTFRKRFVVTMVTRALVGMITFGLFLVLAMRNLHVDGRFLMLHLFSFVLFGTFYTVLFGIHKVVLVRFAAICGLALSGAQILVGFTALWTVAPMIISAITVSIGLRYPRRPIPLPPVKPAENT